MSSASLTSRGPGTIVVAGTWEGDLPLGMLTEQVSPWTIQTDTGKYGQQMYVEKTRGSVVVLTGVLATSR